MQRIYLIGYMGAGKTTLGRALAEVMGLQFVDLDDFIEHRFHKTIREIFVDSGEAGFRDIERNLLREVSTFEDVIISLGGGTPCFFDNMEVVKRTGKSVYLKPTEEVLLFRLVKGKRKRPLLADKDEAGILQTIREQLVLREPFYAQADITFDASRLENKANIRTSAEQLAHLLAELQN
jgi:shikimate kinase